MESAKPLLESTERNRQAAAGIYVHVPFCSAICPYCDFAVSVGNSDRCEEYLAAIEVEVLEQSPPQFSETEFDTVYFGGGTPTILSQDQLARLRQLLSDHYRLAPDTYWTIEANPEDVQDDCARGWRELGFDMVSLGVQSFCDDELRFLGRRHRGHDAQVAVERCLSAGFDTVSIDLMFGLPDQAASTWRQSLDLAVDLRPDHVSCYQLTVHEGTPFARRQLRGQLEELSDTGQGDLFLLTRDTLTAGGLEAYEVSNFARTPSHRSRHNQKYWQHVPYLGIGPSAHSFDGRRRWWNERSFRDYCGQLDRGSRPVAGEESLTDDDFALEVVMLRLRTIEGLDLEAFEARFGYDLRYANRSRWETHVAAGLAIPSDQHFRLTEEGLAVADGIVAQLVVGKPKGTAEC